MKIKWLVAIGLMLVGFMLVAYGFGAPSPTTPTIPIEPEEQTETLPQEEGTGEGGSTTSGELPIYQPGLPPWFLHPIDWPWFPWLNPQPTPEEPETTETTSGGSTGDGGTPYVPPPGYRQPITTLPTGYGATTGYIGVIMLIVGVLLFLFWK